VTTTVYGTVAPGLLVAPPPLADPNFDRTVVLMAVHNEEGALGFVINRAAPLGLGELLAHAGYGERMKRHRGPVYLGGPVQPSSGWVLRIDTRPSVEDRAGVIRIGDRICVSSSREDLAELVHDLETGRPGETDLHRRMVLLGYSGWAAKQLDGELAAGAWLPVPLDEDIVFDPDVERKWERAYARLGLSPAGMFNMRGGGEA
jgi:putative transcriptional regulator